MGSVIEAVGVAAPRPWRREGSVRLATRAARAALASSGRRAGEIELLVQTGVYRDHNLCEPAMAPFVQRRLGANPTAEHHVRDGRSTLSFDLSNGGCGPVQALQVVDGLIRSGRIRRGMVLSGDVDPTPGASHGLGFPPAGAALLVGPGEPEEGFSEFHFESFPKHAHLFSSTACFAGERRRPWRRRPGHALLAREDEGYLAECAKQAEAALGRFLGRVDIDRRNVDLVLASQLPLGFPRALAERTEIDPRHVVDASDRFGPVHTAGVAAALQVAMQRGSWQSARTVLFVAVGAGIGVALALYHAGRGAAA